MPFAQRVVSVWSDLQAAGGVYQATLTKVTSWVTTRRSDGNNQMALTVPLNTPGTDVLGNFSTAALVPPGSPGAGVDPGLDVRDTFTGGTDGNLSGWAPTNPGASGWTGWESTLTDWLVSSGGYVYSNIFQSGGVPIRMDVDTLDDGFNVWNDIFRFSVDTATSYGGTAFLMKNTTIGSFDNREYYRALFTRTSPVSCGLTLEHVKSDGSVDTLASSVGSYDLETSGPSIRLGVKVNGLSCQVYIADPGTGANESVELSATLPVDYRGSNHLRHGAILAGSPSSSQFISGEFGLSSLIPTDPGVTDPSTLVSVIGEGKALRVEREDNSIEEWIVATYEDDVDRDLASLTAVPMAAWVTERVRIRNGDVFTATFSGGLSDGLDNLLTIGNWPAWIIAGTVEVNPLLVVNYYRDNGTSGLGKLVAAANATVDLRLARVTARAVWRRVSGTQWAIDILTSAVTGQPGIIEGSNLTEFKLTNDRTRAAQVITPINEDGVSIGNAYFMVTAFDNGTTRVTLSDWSYGPANLAILVDGQWVGKYVRAPDGTLYEITDSFAASQELECTSFTAGDFVVGDMVRFAESDGSRVYDVALPNRLNPKEDMDVRPWAAETNWAVNSQFRIIEGSPLVPRGWTAVDGASGHLSIETDPDYRETGLQSLKWVATAADEVLLEMDTQQPSDRVWGPATLVTVHFGVRYRTSGPDISVQAFIYGTGSGSGVWTGGGTYEPEVDWITRRGVMYVAGSGGNRGVRLKLVTPSAGTFWIDRVWKMIEGEETQTLTEWCGPAIGLNEGNRTLNDRADGGLAYQVGFLDRHRENPSLYPDDRIEVDQMARLVAPIRDVDTLLPVTQIVIDEYKRHATQVTVGAIPRRLTDLI